MTNNEQAYRQVYEQWIRSGLADVQPDNAFRGQPTREMLIVIELYGQLGMPLKCVCGRMTGKTDVGCQACDAYRAGRKGRS